MRDIESELNIAASADHDRAAAAANGSGVDLQGYDAALAVLRVAALGGTSPTATYKLQESADDSTYADVAAADLIGSQPAAFSAAGQSVLGYKGAKRYLRWRLDALSGTSPTVTAVGIIVRGKARHQPAGETQAP